MIRPTTPTPRPTVRPPALKVVGPQPKPQTPVAPIVVAKPAPPRGVFVRLGAWFESVVAKLRGEQPEAGPKPAPAEPKPAPAAPKPAPVEPPAAEQPPVDAPAPAEAPGQGWQSLDPTRDRLSVTVKPGQTLYQFARLYAQEDKLGAYVKAIQEANGLTGAELTPGQKVAMPIGGSAEWTTPMIAAVQRSVDDRRKAGAKLPELDYTRFEAGQGRFNSYTIDLGLAKGEGSQRFHVLEDMSGDEPYKFKVMLDAEAETLFKEFER